MTSLTIFAMLFGAGNLIFPIRVGMESGNKVFWGLSGFLLTGVILPLLGLLAIVAFHGHYKTFFARVGKVPGFFLTLFCMMVIGPFVVMPRIIGLSYEMLQPFLPTMSMLVFSLIFLVLVFAATYKPSRLLDIIGKFLSPLKVLSIVTIVVIGVLKNGNAQAIQVSSRELFLKGMHDGYYTLDLLGTIFFGSIIVTLLTRYAHSDEKSSMRDAVKITAYSSIFAALLLTGVYLGMGYLGAYHGAGLEHLNEGQIFSAITFRVLGCYGAALIGFTVFLACFTTTVSLTAVVGDYVRTELLANKISYQNAVVIILAICAIIARNGLATILHYSAPFIVASYPIFIVITICNILYKLFDIKLIKIPVAITTGLVIWSMFF